MLKKLKSRKLSLFIIIFFSIKQFKACFANDDLAKNLNTKNVNQTRVKIDKVSEEQLKRAIKERTFYETILNTSKSVHKEIKFNLEKWSSVPESTDIWSQYLNFPPAQQEHRALIVFLHGLNSHPSIWNKHLHSFSKQFPQDLLWAPEILLKGNCSLARASKPILFQLRNYLQKIIEEKKKPFVVLIGASNGARIALNLELRTRSLSSDIFIISIAGPHQGTKRIPFRYFQTDFELYQELNFQSIFSSLFLQKLQRPLAISTFRKYVFYGSLDDIQVSPPISAFPRIYQEEDFYLLQGTDHNGLIHESLEHQMKKYKEWITGKEDQQQ